MVKGYTAFGYEGTYCTVEVDLRRGIPSVDIVGLADGCVKESRERTIAAFKNQNLEFPTERVLISLSPADLRKEGGALDLAIALGIIEAQYGLELKDDVLVMGELELSGAVRPVRAVYGATQNCIGNNIRYAIVPSGNEKEVADGVYYKAVSNLTEAYFALCDLAQGRFETFSLKQSYPSDDDEVKFPEISEYDTSLDEVQKHNYLKYAMAIASTGRHSLIVWGAPGCGKTMTLQRFYQLQPLLTKDESVSVKRLYSLAGLVRPNEEISMKKPFRMPHQTASIEGICGGGINCRPGEISLAHNGVLFLDEAAEFRSSVLQMLRVPLETKSITLSRAGRTTVFPANFQLLMATNPCPCGNYGNKEKICLCSAKSVEMYWKKFSAPLLDRVAIRVDGTNDDIDHIYTLVELRELVQRATLKQRERGVYNNDMTPEQVNDYIIKRIPKQDYAWFTSKASQNDWSSRTVANILKLARTVADTIDCNEEEICWRDCLTEAIKLHNKTPIETE